MAIVKSQLRLPRLQSPFIKASGLQGQTRHRRKCSRENTNEKCPDTTPPCDLGVILRLDVCPYLFGSTFSIWTWGLSLIVPGQRGQLKLERCLIQSIAPGGLGLITMPLADWLTHPSCDPALKHSECRTMAGVATTAALSSPALERSKIVSICKWHKKFPLAYLWGWKQILPRRMPGGCTLMAPDTTLHESQAAKQKVSCGPIEIYCARIIGSTA